MKYLYHAVTEIRTSWGHGSAERCYGYTLGNSEEVKGKILHSALE